MVQAADSIEMIARRNCATILLALDKPSMAASGVSRRHTSPYERLYKCKDCNRAFGSFQALGGHRASHMKLRLPHKAGDAVAEPVKVHECGQCRGRFPTGQALGGHMRKHAEFGAAKRKRAEEGFESSEKRQRVVLQLDLNCPPPVDEPVLQLGISII